MNEDTLVITHKFSRAEREIERLSSKIHIQMEHGSLNNIFIRLKTLWNRNITTRSMRFVKKSEMIFFTGIKTEKYQKKGWIFTEKNERDFIFNFSH